MSLSLFELMDRTTLQVETLCSDYLQPAQSAANELTEAMRYAVFNGGKRIRPLLVYATGLSFAGSEKNLAIPAAAIELIHAYSLIHDDLPAMDNADLRRGKPSCHKVYGEALAILAGDALQTLAFSVLAHHPATLSAEQRLHMIQVVSLAAGLEGMAGGQALDIAGMDQLDTLQHMYSLKTGALLTASVKLGMIAANQYSPEIQQALEQFANCLGLAFQIQDDLLDIASPEAQTGKPLGLDIENEKTTFILLLGKKGAESMVRELFDQCIQALTPLGKDAYMLHALAKYVLQRKN